MDHTKCTECKSTYYLLTISSPASSTCYLKTAIPDTYGIIYGKYLLTSCLDTNCKKCVDDFQDCSECKSVGSAADQLLYLWPRTPPAYITDTSVSFYSCSNVASLPNGVGFSSTYSASSPPANS